MLLIDTLLIGLIAITIMNQAKLLRGEQTELIPVRADDTELLARRTKIN